MTSTARHLLVSGRVQGVAFRWATAAQAEQLGVDGWVRNLSDGRVEAVVQGTAEAVEAMLAWMGRGPPPARVDELVPTEIPAEELSGFEIRSTAHVA